MVTIKNLTKKFNSTVAIDDLTLDIEKGKITGLIGADGAGKTTLIRLIIGLMLPDSGEISVLNLNPVTQKDELNKYICNTQQQAILSVMTFMMPAMLLSGFISPISDMPLYLQYVTYLNPVRFFMLLTRGIILKGMGVEDVIINLIPMIIIAIITLTLAGRTFKRKLG